MHREQGGQECRVASASAASTHWNHPGDGCCGWNGTSPLEVLLLDVSARLEDAVQREDHVNIFSSVDDLLGRERAPQPPAMIKLGSLGT